MNEYRFLNTDGPYTGFDPNGLARPDPALGPSYSWIWNDKLSRDEIDVQLEGMRDGGIRSVYVIPEPSDFRPGTMDTYLEPDYLTPEYWQYFRYAMEKARSLGMVLWLYDEGGWPSGSACGKIAAAHPELASAVLDREEITLHQGESVPADTVALFDGEQLLESPASGRRLTRYYRRVIPGGGWSPAYTNLLEQDTVDTFIGMTHEACKAVCGDLFGDAMPFCFTDEPAVRQVPWAHDAAEDFLERKGYDIRPFLPLLFRPAETEKERLVRADWFDWWSRRFADVYLGSLRRWCGANSLLSIGHLGGDDATLGCLDHGYGHILRALRAFDVPGVDAIWRQIFPAPRLPYKSGESPYQTKNGSYGNHYYPRYAASAAHQQGLRWCFTETGAVYGSGYTLAQNTWVCLYQMVRGISLINQMDISYGRTGHLMTGEKPLYFPEMPGYAQLGAFNRMLSRLSYLLSLGEPDVGTALYLPTRDIWAGGESAKKAVALHDRAAFAAERMQCGFDIFDDDVLENGVIGNGKLTYGGASYDTLIITENAGIDKARLALCEASGIRVIRFDGDTPDGELPRLVMTRERELRVLRRRTKDGPLYLLWNESLDEIRPEVLLPELCMPVEIDVLTGKIRTVKGELTGKGFAIRPRLSSGEAMVLLFAEVKENAAPRFEAGQPVKGLCDFTLRPVRRFEIGEERYESLYPNAAALPTGLGDWRGMLGGDFSGEAEYVCEFTLSAGEASDAKWLSLGDVRYSCEAELNGVRLGDLFAPPFAAETAGLLHEGTNTLRVVLANTAANQFVNTKSFEKYKPGQLGPYHEKTMPFEPESLPSGLYGPVVLYKG